jgi:hypothetical protein
MFDSPVVLEEMGRAQRLLDSGASRSAIKCLKKDTLIRLCMSCLADQDIAQLHSLTKDGLIERLLAKVCLNHLYS